MAIFIKKNITRVYRDCSWVYLTKVNSLLRPIFKCFSLAKITEDSKKYIFTPIATSETKGIIRKNGKRKCQGKRKYTSISQSRDNPK